MLGRRVTHNGNLSLAQLFLERDGHPDLCSQVESLPYLSHIAENLYHKFWLKMYYSISENDIWPTLPAFSWFIDH